MKIALIINTGKENAFAVAEQIASILTAYDSSAELVTLSRYGSGLRNINAERVPDFKTLFSECDLALTVGGDGTIIHSAKYAAAADKPLIGVNLGRLGFAAEVEADGIQDLTRLLSGDYEIRERMLLNISVTRKNGSTENYVAVNDAAVSRGQLAHIIDVSVSLDNSPISTYRADGVLFSTPTGSTAYSLSAGGPVIYPEMKCILLTPICPHSLISRSVVFDGRATLTAKVETPDDAPAILSVDGEKNVEINSGDLITITKSPKKLKLVTLYNRNFYQLLNEKLRERKA